MNRRKLEDNPFFVLEVSPEATRMDVERAGQKLLAQLAIQVASAKTYRTPLGIAERDEAKVRTALAALRNPEERVLFESWVDPARVPEAASAPAAPGDLPPFEAALPSIGWRGPCTV
jgi:hypothetical protein